MDNSSCQSFSCNLSDCSHTSSRYSNLLRHYRQNPSHKPENLRQQGRPSETADDVISSVFNDNLAPGTRSARAKVFVSKLSDEELQKHCLPRLVKLLKPWQFLLESAKTWNGLHLSNIVSRFKELKEGLLLKYPELLMTTLFTTDTQKPTQCDSDLLLEFIKKNKHLTCNFILDDDNEQSLFKEILMPMVYEKHSKTFLDFACGLVGSFGISQRDIQDLLRNKWGKQISEVLGINIFPPKDDVVKCLKAKKEELANQVGLAFEEKSNGIVVATINVAKYLEYLLTRPGIQNAIAFPKNAMIIYQFTDLAPWLKWSRFSNSITTSRLKIVDPYNLHSVIITCGAYLGPDDYETLNLCFKNLYDQICATDTVELPHEKEPIKIHLRSTADGKQRRLDTGMGTAKSTYPICDAPEHSSQLGDMTLVSSGPEWTVQDTKELATKYQDWLNGKNDNDQNRRDFAKLNLGNMGRQNLTGVDMKDYYIGGFHLAIRAAETISDRIGQCATGNNIIQQVI